MTGIPEITSDFFSGVQPLSRGSLQAMKNIFKLKTFEPNEDFIRISTKNRSEYFVLEGYCRSYVLNPEGEEITLSFFKKGNVITPHLIRTRDDISLMNYQALTKTELIEFDAGEFLNMMIQNLEIREFGNTVLRNELVRKTDLEITLASQTAAERLESFRKEYGMLENLIPHPIIASYLGITNVSLSRLRGKK
jgi:CRP-like cAMP-binding protein